MKAPPLTAQLVRPVPLPRSVYGYTGDSVRLGVGWGLDGTTWHQRETPEGWLGPQPALCLSSLDAGASLPHGAQKERGASPPGSGLKGGGWLERGFEWATPPTVLEACEDFCVQGPPPRPAAPSQPFQGHWLGRAGEAHGWGKGGEGRVVCAREGLSSGLEGLLEADSASVHTGHFLKEVSFFLMTIKAMSTHHALCPQSWICPEGALFLMGTEMFCRPQCPEAGLGVTHPWVGIWVGRRVWKAHNMWELSSQSSIFLVPEHFFPNF